jgi:hypothetical protein
MSKFAIIHHQSYMDDSYYHNSVMVFETFIEAPTKRKAVAQFKRMMKAHGRDAKFGRFGYEAIDMTAKDDYEDGLGVNWADYEPVKYADANRRVLTARERSQLSHVLTEDLMVLVGSETRKRTAQLEETS